jgi:hypothetical protein
MKAFVYMHSEGDYDCNSDIVDAVYLVPDEFNESDLERLRKEYADTVPLVEIGKRKPKKMYAESLHDWLAHRYMRFQFISIVH